MRVLVIGNSGAGKSTLARGLAATHGLAHLDLDTLVWEPDAPATPRPWEPHKYPSKAAQDAMLEPLLQWTAGYYTRDDAWSYAAHRRIFDAFDGVKRELT